MGQMQYAADVESLKMIDRLRVDISDKTVTVEFRAPAAEVWTHFQKAARLWMERSPWGRSRQAATREEIVRYGE